jgi:hypothetical protein
MITTSKVVKEKTPFIFREAPYPWHPYACAEDTLNIKFCQGLPREEALTSYKSLE